MQIISHSPKETTSLGKRVARLLKKGDVIALFGTLGSGKTTFVKGLAYGLGVRKIVNSPSFVLLKNYQGRLTLYHFDFYRIKDSKEIYNLGYQEYIFADGIAAIEWSERIEPCLPQNYLKIVFILKNETKRLIKIIPQGKSYKRFVNKI